MKHGIYTGGIKHLEGKTALLRDTEPFDRDKVLAQFDEHTLTRSGGPLPTVEVLEYEPHARFPTTHEELAAQPNHDCLAFGWHEFDRNDFLEFGVRE